MSDGTLNTRAEASSAEPVAGTVTLDRALVEDDFAPIWDDSILLTEHKAVHASVAVGGWLSAALDDPNVCDAMKADINRWFSAGFLYLDEVRKLMQTEREALEAENERLRETLGLADAALRGANMNMNVVERKVRAALKEKNDG